MYVHVSEAYVCNIAKKK